jgi:hypothetical protein
VRQDPKDRRDRKVTSGPLAPQVLLDLQARPDPPARLDLPDHRALKVYKATLVLPDLRARLD